MPAKFSLNITLDSPHSSTSYLSPGLNSFNNITGFLSLAEILTFLLGLPAATDLKQKKEKCYFVSKIVLSYCEKKNDREKLEEAEGREFAKILRLLEQFLKQNVF